MIISSTSIIKKFFLLFLFFSGLYFAKNFLIPITIGGVLATLFFPFYKWMVRIKIPKGISVSICLFVFLIVVSGITFLVIWQISEFAYNIPLIKKKAIESVIQIQKLIFDNLGITMEKQSQILQNEQPSLSDLMKLITNSTISIFTNFILILVYMFGLLYYSNHVKYFLLKLFPLKQRKEIENIILNISHVSQHYLFGLSKMIVCLWIMYGIGFSIIGVENPFFFAIICGLLEIVPFIGNITGTTITLMVTAIQGASLLTLVSIIGTYGLIQFIQGWILEPIIVGSQVKINPLSTIVALVLGEIIWGLPGVFLAIPLIAMIKIICDHIEPLKPYGFLIGEVISKK